MKGDRILGVVLLIIAFVYGWEAVHFPEPFGGAETVGPETFPIMLSIILGISSIYLLIKPDADSEWPGVAMLSQLLFVIIALAIFTALLEPVGFIPATIFVVSFLCWRMGSKPVPALTTGVCCALSVFLLFNFVLDLHLPAGILEFG